MSEIKSVRIGEDLKPSCVEHKYKGDVDGYALTTGRINGLRRTYRVHRKVCADKYGLSLDDIKGMVVMHTCDNPRCINPEHLLLGSHGDNQKDKVNKGRQAKRDNHGATLLDSETVAHIRDNYVPYSREWGAPAIARRLGVSTSCITHIVSNHTWREDL